MRHATRVFAMCVLAIGLLLASAAAADERFPPPDFTDHKLPVTQVPAPRAEAFQYLDLTALAAALAMASYLAIVKRSRRGLFALTIVSLAWLGFWREGCICPIGSIQNVTLAAFEPAYALPWTVAVLFVLPIIFTLFFGRTFCAAVCPLGAAQELVALRPVNVPTWLDQSLGLLAYVYLGAGVLFAATGTAFVICRYDPFVGFFRRSASTNMLILGGCFLVGGIFIGRPYCRYLCPYGAILGLVSRVSKWHVKIPPDQCIQCRLCEDACPYGAIRQPSRSFAAGRAAVRTPAIGRAAGSLPGAGRPADSGWAANWKCRCRGCTQPCDWPTASVWSNPAGVEGTIDASDAFRNTGRTTDDLYREASLLSTKFRTAGGWLGAWVGLVIGAKLIHLSVRRRRSDYQPDRTACVSCGRCFWYCPGEQARQGWIQDIATTGGDCPPRRTEGDRSMFSALRLFAKRLCEPKNGPVP